MSSRKEVRFSDEKGSQNKMKSLKIDSSPRHVLRERNARLVPSLTRKQNWKIKSSVPPPPPPPPLRKRSPVPTPKPTSKSKNTFKPTAKAKRSAIPHPPPPPPPRLLKTGVEHHNSQQRTPSKAKAVSNQEHYFSSFPKDMGGDKSKKTSLRNDEIFVTEPVLTILSPMSGITNSTDFNSPNSSIHRKRSILTLDTTLNSIDMLNFQYIESCSCIPDLQRVVRLLSESKTKSPHLMKAAMKRLTTMQQQQDSVQNSIQIPSIGTRSSSLIPSITDDGQQSELLSPSNGEKFAQGVTNISRITTTNTTLDSFDPGKSSLNFSLSPSSTLQGIDLIETPKIAELNFFDNGTEGITRRLCPIVESPVTLKPYCTSRAGGIHDSLKNANATNGQPLVESSDFCVYRNNSKKFELEKSNFNGRDKGISLPPPREPKKESFAAQQIQHLKKNLDEKKSDNQELKATIRKVTKEREEAKKTLDIARSTLCKKDEETKAIEERLESRITELGQVLASTAERSKMVVEGERTYRKQCEEELLKENKKNAKLNHELKETRNSLEKLQRRHSSFRVELLKVTGINKTERRSLSQQEFVISLSKKIKTMKEDNERMAKTLEQNNQAIQERDLMELQMNDALQSHERLVMENQKLSTKIQELRAEVKSSRAYIDKLLRTSHETKSEDWESQEQQYKQVIKNLRKQIRKQDAAISIDLYKVEKDKVRYKAQQLRIAESTIHTLNAEVAELRENGIISSGNRSHTGVDKKYATESKTPRNSENKENNQKSKSEFYSKFRTPRIEKKREDLTGITITFQNSPEITHTTRETTVSPRSVDLYLQIPDFKLGDVTETRNENGLMKKKSSNVLGEVTLSDHENKKMSYTANKIDGISKNSNQGHDFEKNLGNGFGKENPTTPKTTARESPLRLVRDFGGRSALKDKIKKMRSPKVPISTMMSRQEIHS